MSGCGGLANQCLQTPASTKVSDESADVCRQALAADLDRQDVFQRYMDILRVRGHHTDVIKWSRKVLRRDKGRTDAIYNYAVGLRKVGKCKKAVKAYKVYARKNKADPDPHYGVALCYEDLGESQNAIEAYERYKELEKRPSQKEWVAKADARIAALRGTPVPGPAPVPAPPTAATPAPKPAPVAVKPAPAPVPKPAPKPVVKEDCSVHQKAFTANPFDTKAYDKYAVCALKDGKHADVIKRLRMAVRDNPDYVKGWLRLGQAYKAAGNAGQASAAFKKACSSGVSAACGK